LTILSEIDLQEEHMPTMTYVDASSPSTADEIEDLSIELERTVTAAMRKRLAGEPADAEIGQIDRITSRRMALQRHGKPRLAASG
jgi:hypothetical protein